jgi:hypothetical protein
MTFKAKYDEPLDVELKIRLTKSQKAMLDLIKKHYGTQSDSDAVRQMIVDKIVSMSID